MQNPAPIALFVYNRPEHTRRTISYLQKNLLADESRLFIFSDAAKTHDDNARVEEVRQVVSDISGFKSVKVIKQASNLGLADSIINGVSQLVKDYGKVIVFEDDLLSSVYTLKYFNDALNKYETQDKVMHIGAYMFKLTDKDLPESFFFRAATSWGWATWERAWKNFEPDVNVLYNQFDNHKVHEFSINGTMNFWRQLQQFRAGKNNSWAIRWYASIFLKGGLTLNPAVSLIQNIGTDGSGVHSKAEKTYDVKMSDRPVTYFPDEIKENLQAYNAIKHFLKHRRGGYIRLGLYFIRQVQFKLFSKL